MTSIMTNNAALAALQTLRSINDDLETTQNRISSGYRVESAKDNSAYWSIATTMRSDNKALSTVTDALGLGSAKVDTAYTGLNSALDVVSEIKAKLVAAREPGVDKEKINSELSELKNQLVSITDSAAFSGENWLKNASTTAAATDKEIVAGFNRDSSGNVTLTTLTVDVTSSILISKFDAGNGLLTKDIDAGQLVSPTTAVANYFLIAASSATAATGTEITISSTTTDAAIEAMISVVDEIFSQMTDVAADMGATSSRVSMQENFVEKLMDSIDMGVGRLVDADMNEESTRLKALQTQQQLGVQALSIANSNAENVMQLFQ